MDLDLSDFIVSKDTMYVPAFQKVYNYAWDNSVDPSTKTGAGLMDPGTLDLIAMGVNHLMDGIPATDDILLTDKKYLYMIHAETDVISKIPGYVGINPLIMIMPWVPCEPCADAIIAEGNIQRYVAHKQMVDRTPDGRWIESINRGLKKMYNARIELVLYDGPVGVHGFMSGKDWRA